MLLRKFSQTLRISLALMVATFSTGLLPTSFAYAHHETGHTGGATGQTVCPDDSFTELLGGWDKTDGINALSWDIPEKAGYTVTDVCYKASTSVVYPDPITDPVVSTVWNNESCTEVGPGCNYQNISHASVYYTKDVVTPTPVTAGVVTYTDLCGTADDTYTVPVTPNVTYSVEPGTHAGVGTVTVTATANTGYTLTAPYTFSYMFTNVACETPLIPVTAGTVTYADVCGTSNDTFTVPTTPNVTYSVEPGTHAGVGTVTVTATANTGYTLTAPYTFSYMFTNVACPDSTSVTLCHATGSETNPFVRITVSAAGAFNGHLDDDFGGNSDHQNGEDIIPTFTYNGNTYSQNWVEGDVLPEDCVPAEAVIPAEVQFLNPTCENPLGRVVITATEGVTYKVGDTVVTGTVSYPGGTSVTVTAEASDESYVLDEEATTSWSHTFTAAPTGCVLGDNDVCPNIEGTQSVVPTGMIQNTMTGECFTPGGRGGVTPATQVLGASTQALPETLPSTGGADSPLAIIIASILAYGAAYFLQGRRLLGRKEALSA